MSHAPEAARKMITFRVASVAQRFENANTHAPRPFGFCPIDQSPIDNDI
jgi:hypothetical protein